MLFWLRNFVFCSWFWRSYRGGAMHPVAASGRPGASAGGNGGPPFDVFRSRVFGTLAREFNMVEPEDVMKWWVVRRNSGVFDFAGGDEVVRFAQAHHMKVRGHCLVWDHNNPKWLTQGKFTPAQLSALLQEHITTVMNHYAGQVFAWDVVNEALDENGQVKDSPWYNQPGIGFSDKAPHISSKLFAGRARLIRRRCFFTTRRRGKD